MRTKETVTILIDCPDQTGLVARVSGLLYSEGANILHADQHSDHEAGLFFMRVEWALDSFDIDHFRNRFQSIASELQMRWRLAVSTRVVRLAIFVSQHLHCLQDLLYRVQSGELRCIVPLVISNHECGRALSEFYGVPFYHIPILSSNKQAAEQQQLALLRDNHVDLILLARYMQILSPYFVGQYPNRVINVHHSFLPAFIGAKPYHQAFCRGVKLIGATSHYVNEDLDTGPIIEQDVLRVSHRDHVPDLIEKGRDLERIVLSRAARLHLDNRVLSYGKKTVIFD